MSTPEPHGRRRRARLPLHRASAILAATLAALLGASGVALAAVITTRADGLTVFQSASTVPVTTCTLSASTADAYGDGALLTSDTNFGGVDRMHVRSDSLGNARSFVRFDVGSCAIPANASVTSATLRLALTTAPATSRTLEAHRVTAEWTEGALTWNTKPAVAPSATASATTGTVSGVTLQWNVHEDAKAFVAGTATNLGWQLRDSVEGASSAHEARLATRENATASLRPRLVITYYP